MIECLSIETAHLFGDALASQHRLRRQVFVERQNWDVPTYKDMEFDQYDTPAAHYLVWRDEAEVVRGVTRFGSTERPYMIKDHWPDMVSRGPLPETHDVWEATRFGIDRSLEPAVRKRVVAEMVCAYLEFGLRMGFKWVLGATPTLIWRAVFIRNGWDVDYLGEPRKLGVDNVVAGVMPVTPEYLARVRAKTGIRYPVLRTAEDLDQRIAA